MIAARSTAAAAQTDDSSMTAAAGAEARVLVIGCEEMVVARAGKSRRMARVSADASGEANCSRGIAETTSNIAELYAGYATGVVVPRRVPRISAESGEFKVPAREAGTTASEPRVRRRTETLDYRRTIRITRLAVLN